ncbi:MAG: GNAT family N-acetyltransferase, partial [Flavobacteriaceae bacterium]|nr:GNAT family N-acetyltransferase [Flavobacteriaceae bacterium]
MIRNITLDDASAIAEIYNYYIENTVVTFDEDTVNVKDIEQRIKKVQSKNYPYIGYEKNGSLLGYAYLDRWRERSAYDITLETSIYLHRNCIGKGLGSVLYRELIERAKLLPVHSLIGVISLPNEPSRKLHERTGFQLIG